MQKREKFAAPILLLLKNQNATYKYPVSRRSKNHTEDRPILNALFDLVEQIKNQEIRDNKFKDYAFESILGISGTSEYQWEKRKWESLALALREFLTEQGYWILEIVDGVDNIHTNDRKSKKYYKDILAQLYNFSLRKPTKQTVHMAVARERTYLECCCQEPLPDPVGFVDIIEIYHHPPCHKKMMDARSLYAASLLKKGGKFAEIWNEIIAITPFENYIIKHENARHYSLNHENARVFLFNKLSLVAQIYYRILQLGGKTYNLSNQINLFENRNKFLNGRLFLQTDRKWHQINSEFGLYCINIFYFNIISFPCVDMLSWSGLSKTRIIQFLLKLERLTEDNLTQLMTIGLEYNEELVWQNISDLKSYGIIDTKYKHSSKSLYLEVSKKGKAYIEDSYSDIDTFYYFCLDTPLPQYLVDNKLVNSHDNKLHDRDEDSISYPFSCITTTITFVSFLNAINAIENKKLHKNKTTLPNKILTKIQDILNEELSLPFHKYPAQNQFIESLKYQLKNCSDLDVEKIKVYLQAVNPLLTQQLTVPDPGTSAFKKRWRW